MRHATLLMPFFLAAGGCAATLGPENFEGTTPLMRPDVFFAGTTRSTGVEESASGAPMRRFRVEGHGTSRSDGAFQLDQDIDIDGDAPEHRSWSMRRIDAHRYTATLTDASGEVEAEAYGNVFHLRYPMKTPIGGRMEQWLYLQPDGRTVVNEATVRVFGIVVAHLSERITHEAD